MSKMAGWQSGYAADCKSVYAGSIPTSASIKTIDPGNPGFFVPAWRRDVSSGLDRVR